MTTVEEELAEQRRWTAVQRRPTSIHDRLVRNEFISKERHRTDTAAPLLRMLHFSGQAVPYYKRRTELAKIAPGKTDPFEALAALPVLTKFDVQENNKTLRAVQLPPGEEIGTWKSSSGSTGRPTMVLHTKRSMTAFQLFKQREYRWFRFDPAATLATIRLSVGVKDISETNRFKTWNPLLNFSTGPLIAYSVINSPESQIAWLRRESPKYLMTYSETLEQLALIAGDEQPCDSLEGLLAISEQLTPHMRAHVERSFDVPVQQNYGLNEIGLVGGRCEAGRYHVHREGCLVELLREDGAPAKVGETGRLVVTSLVNSAMPLLRYDSGDLAEAVDGNCPCGRSLPSFGEIVGRYSRIAYLPENTLGLVAALRSTIEEMPHVLIRNLREFQIHQYRDNSFEIRLVTLAPLDSRFEELLRAAWSKATEADPLPLSFVNVDAIAPSPGGKKQVFTSDFVEHPQTDEHS